MRLRFDIDLEDEEVKTLDALGNYCHRNRKNMVEALIKISISTFKEGRFFIQLNNLGTINGLPHEPGEREG